MSVRPGWGNPFGNPWGGSVPASPNTFAPANNSAQLGDAALGDLPLGGQRVPSGIHLEIDIQFSASFTPPAKFESDISISTLFAASSSVYARVTQVAREILQQGGNPNARVTQVAREILQQGGNPYARVTQIAREILIIITPRADGAIVFDGSIAPVGTLLGVAQGAITFGGSVSGVIGFIGRVEGAIILSGSSIPSGGLSGEGDGAIVLDGSVIGSGAFAGVASAVIIFSGSVIGNGSFSTPAAGTIQFGGEVIGPLTSAGITAVTGDGSGGPTAIVTQGSYTN